MIKGIVMAKIKERGSTHIYKVNRIPPEEINGMTSLCIHEEPPYCNAACPLKLDTRAMMEAAAAGNFKKALQIYNKATPFPALLSSGCEAPCMKNCKLKELGEPVEIRKIEQAIAAFGEATRSSGVFRTKKKKTAAIFGEDLFCLFLAGELEKKMYPVKLFTSRENLDEFLEKINAGAEKERLSGMDIDFEFGCSLSPEFFAEKRAEFDVCCAGEKEAKEFFPEALCNETYMVYEAEKLVMGSGEGMLNAAFGAKKAALSVDRLAQNLHPGNTRGDEGPVETRLYTDTSGVKALKAVPGERYSKEEAIEEAKRCLLCHCDECMKACAYLREYEKFPSLIGREIYNNTQIIMGTHPLNEAMNSCTLCGQCKVVCPNGFDMATICHHARQNMVSTDKMPLAQHEFALLDMCFANEDAFLARPQPGFEKCSYVFFPGCQATAIAPETVKSAYEDLCKRLGGGVALLLGCCGAPADWSGREEIYEQTKAQLKEELQRLGNPLVIAGCPTCLKQLSSWYDKTEGIWTILNEIGIPEAAKALSKPAAIHDSCGARGDEKTQKAIRALAEKLGIETVDMPYSGDEAPCCGFGGLTAFANKPLAKKITESCLERSDAPFISYCMACRDRFAREGRESHHILEILYGTDAGAPPDISERRFNRLSLKQELLKNLWGEEIMEETAAFKTEYTEQALAIMDERYILKSDVEEVLNHAFETGERIYDEDSKLFIACARPGNVTFWVKFEEIDGGYRVHRAWSHRMFIQNREG